MRAAYRALDTKAANTENTTDHITIKSAEMRTSKRTDWIPDVPLSCILLRRMTDAGRSWLRMMSGAPRDAKSETQKQCLTLRKAARQPQAG